MILKNPYRNSVGRIKFIPFYPNKNDYAINGTQLFTRTTSNNLWFAMPNFENNDFQFRTKVSNVGYKEYVDSAGNL